MFSLEVTFSTFRSSSIFQLKLVFSSLTYLLYTSLYFLFRLFHISFPFLSLSLPHRSHIFEFPNVFFLLILHPEFAARSAATNAIWIYICRYRGGFLNSFKYLWSFSFKADSPNKVARFNLSTVLIRGIIRAPKPPLLGRPDFEKIAKSHEGYVGSVELKWFFLEDFQRSYHLMVIFAWKYMHKFYFAYATSTVKKRQLFCASLSLKTRLVPSVAWYLWSGHSKCPSCFAPWYIGLFVLFVIVLH